MTGMADYKRRVEESVAFLQRRIGSRPEVIMILGTGLGGLAKRVEEARIIPYREIPHFPRAKVESHAGNLVRGRLGNREVVILQGRAHHYEGYSCQELTLPLRVLTRLGGAQQLLITNAAGGLNPDFQPGSLMLIADHLNLLGDNPLRGPNHDEWGPRFPDLSEPYSKKLLRKAERCALALNLNPVKHGVYAAIPGPSLETPAETRYLRQCGADAVGMSTVPEVIVAKHAGLDVLGLSVIANVNDPDRLQPIVMSEVIAQAEKAAGELESLLIEFLRRGD